MTRVDLIQFMDGTSQTPWNLGCALSVRPENEAVVKAIEQTLTTSIADAVLFWDPSLGTPDQAIIQDFVASPLDCWHAGIKLGMGGLPGILDFISPTWMLSCDSPVDIEATSWRISLRACLVRMEVLRKLGGLRPEFQTLEAAALEMAHRWIRNGALMRHVPALIRRQPSASDFQSSGLPFVDELRFAYYRFGGKWAAWALFRGLMTGYVSLPSALRAWRKVMSTARPSEPAPYRTPNLPSLSAPIPLAHQLGEGSRVSEMESGERAGMGCALSTSSTLNSQRSALVSVLIPTVDRYSYLRTLLGQLRQQTVRPLEIIIIDQTATERRREGLFEEFSDLPLKVILQNEPGQCTSRNAGLQTAVGEYVLFIDDDDEVPPDLIEAHLQNLTQFRAEVSSGVANEVGTGPLPADFCLLRTSDVFPTNNTMIRRDVLRRSGLFDLAYNHRQRADGDLGMRIYLAGALMVLNPAISVLHHHAAAGGLRKHKARTVTYSMSRGKVFC
jgi:hypothetical protein